MFRKPELKTFVRKISNSKDFKQNFILKPKFSQILFFNKEERKKILEKFNLSSNSQIQFGFKAIINNVRCGQVKMKQKSKPSKTQCQVIAKTKKEDIY